MVKRTGNEISITFPTIDVGAAKINIGLFSNKIVKLVEVPSIVSTLDISQFAICTTGRHTLDPELKVTCEKLQLQMVLALTQLASIFEAIKINPSPEISEQLSEWIKYCGSLIKHAIESVIPGTKKKRKILSQVALPKEAADLKREDIMKYQNITYDDMNEALTELHSATEAAADLKIEDIMKYQNITQNYMNEALTEHSKGLGEFNTFNIRKIQNDIKKTQHILQEAADLKREDIMKYQNITQNYMNEALTELASGYMNTARTLK